MPEINYKDLKKHLKKFVPVYLIYGEEMLYKTSLNELLDAMIPADKRSHNYDPFDGTDENIQEALERVNTYSLMPGTKVVAICDSNIFYAKQDKESILEKAKDAYDKEDNKDAARCLLNLMKILNLSLEDLQPENRNKTVKETLKIDTDILDDDLWVSNIISYCIENNLDVPSSGDSADRLQQAIKKGFPKGNHLVITTDMADKRRKLYKTIKEKGLIIDCSVPKGDLSADKKKQATVLKESKNAILEQSGKTMEENAFKKMYEMTGFDLRTFTQNLEKLVSYIGKRKKITVNDVESVLERTKKDPVYALSNAIASRNIEMTLSVLNSLLGVDKFHPLQALAGLANQIRRLLLVKGFIESSYGDDWDYWIGLGYLKGEWPTADFKNYVIPAIQEHDRALLDQIKSWENQEIDDQSSTKKKKKKTDKWMSDFVIVKNPNSPIPVYKLLKNSERFTKNELISALEILSEADVRLKSTGQNPKLILEQAIIKICRKE